MRSEKFELELMVSILIVDGHSITAWLPELIRFFLQYLKYFSIHNMDPLLKSATKYIPIQEIVCIQTS